MNGYLTIIIGTVLLCAIITAILPNGKTATVIQGVAKMMCLLAIVAPIPDFLKGKSFHKNLNKSVLKTDQSFIEYYGNMRIEQAERVVETDIQDNFSIRTNVLLTTTTDSALLEIVSMRVTLCESGTKELKTAMSEYLTKMYGCGVIIE